MQSNTVYISQDQMWKMDIVAHYNNFYDSCIWRLITKKWAHTSNFITWRLEIWESTLTYTNTFNSYVRRKIYSLHNNICNSPQMGLSIPMGLKYGIIIDELIHWLKKSLDLCPIKTKKYWYYVPNTKLCITCISPMFPII